MKYFLIAGEASGDLHASHLIAALRERDAEAEFRFYGGDLMRQAASGGLLRHYKTLAYMGFIQVALHARTILRGLADCKRAIADFAPHCIILIDYPGFNLKIARWAKETLPATPVYYYISPKIWAWKEYRIKSIRAYVDRLFSILPFEVDFYEKKHHYPIAYVGNPTYDEVSAYLAQRGEDVRRIETYGQEAAERTDAIALLPGSRKQEIRDNLRIMLDAVGQRRLNIAIAAAPGIDDAFYREVLGSRDATIVRGHTYDLLRTARAALVTSGTATLEAALLDVPQVVCYKMTGGRLINWIRPIILSCRFISLVNLIADAEVVPELIAADMNAANVRRHLDAIIDDPARPARAAQLSGYDLIRQRLATPGAPQRAAEEIVTLLKAHQ